MHWDYPKIPKTITFTRLFPETTITPTEDPAGLNLAGLNFSNKSFRKEDILKSQSSLFRLFVLDRTNPDWSFVHPIISRLVKVCTKLNEAHEFVDLKNNEKIIPKRNTNTIQTITSQPIVSTNPAQLQAASVSSSITVSSQRLLDSYCMMYYRTLAHANALNLTIVLKVLQIAARELSISSQQPSLTSIPTAPATKLSHRILQAIQLMFHRNLFNLPRQSVSRSTTSSINNVGNENGEQNTATGIPHTNVPAETFEDSLGGLLSSHTALREGLMSFAPGSMNSETAEFIEELLNFGSCVDENPGKIFSGNSSSNGIDGKSIQHEADAMHDEENFEIFKCMGWMREVIKWQRAGRQMEPVKDLLRRSMGRIDRLRGVQRKFGLYFMD
ncbi:hypothetical protein HK100_000744 [Physocladia obscura]|uniref:Uncharacterized protein n=1 Tax=Physocladia obscura TaxID=109957 RepID=A0AAD5XBL4_9FUNG|nr:hypothetical protein HK100_000744 [Physocladia obscura]